MAEGYFTFPPMAPGQIGWYIDSPSNRHIVGPNWIARDFFPLLITERGAIIKLKPDAMPFPTAENDYPAPQFDVKMLKVKF